MSYPSRQYLTINDCSTQFNIAVTNITPLPARQNGSHAIVGIFRITVSVLLASLQLKYQVRTDSPFQDHPISMAIAIASLLIFCLGCDLEQYLVKTNCSSTFATLTHYVLRLFGFISLASLASVIFSTSSTSSLVVYLIFAWFFCARLMLQYWMKSKNVHRSEGAYNFYNLRPHVAFSH